MYSNSMSVEGHKGTLKILRWSVLRNDNLTISRTDCLEMWQPQHRTFTACAGLYGICSFVTFTNTTKYVT